MKKISCIFFVLAMLGLLGACGYVRERAKSIMDSEQTEQQSQCDVPAIQPSAIDAGTIRSDLIGRTITGVDTGFITRKTQMTITEDKLQEVTVKNQEQDGDDLFIEADILLNSEGDGSFIGHVRLEYRQEATGWRIVMVQSQGIEFVRTGRYLSCITHTSHTLPGEESVTLYNSSDHDLAVGGYYLAKDDTWQKFCVTVPANGEYVLGCWFMETVRDIRVEFAEFP